MNIKKNTYIKIRSDSITELHLKGNELLVYSIIESVALNNNDVFKYSISFLMLWSGLTKPTVIKILKNLTNKKIIFKYDGKDIKNRYKPFYKINYVKSNNSSSEDKIFDEYDDISIEDLIQELKEFSNP